MPLFQGGTRPRDKYGALSGVCLVEWEKLTYVHSPYPTNRYCIPTMQWDKYGALSGVCLVEWEKLTYVHSPYSTNRYCIPTMQWEIDSNFHR